MGLRTRLTLLWLAAASPAAAGVLPLEGAYGNDAGCNFYLYGEKPTGDYLLLTGDTLSSPHLACDFGSLVTSADGHATVDAVCSPGGKASIDIEDKGAAGFAISAAGMTLGPALPCPAVPADPKGTLRS